MVKEKELTAKIRELLSARSAESSICPSDVARAAAPDDWRPLMEPVREAAATWWPTAKYRSPQGGEVVDPESVRGPIRIRWLVDQPRDFWRHCSRSVNQRKRSRCSRRNASRLRGSRPRTRATVSVGDSGRETASCWISRMCSASHGGMWA